MTSTESLPLLDGEQWLEVVDNSEAGEEIPSGVLGLPYYRGQVTTFGAETGVGKTAMGLQEWRWVADNGLRAAYCTLEMSAPLLFKRFVTQFDSEQECRDWIGDTNAHISQSYLDHVQVEQILRDGFDFVVIDHIHELPFDGHEDLSRKVHRIASLAPETNTAILLLSQMKQRDPEFDTGPPSKYDYSWTKAIPDVSAVCQAIWRPDEYSPDVELVTLKHRFGLENPPVPLTLDRATVTFRR